ncbi:MAG TPA: hypothetical protein VEK07_21930 [Polyangiaceae bacterium]|nr:hypothetical protein [Polyangiaceae bacterium]
MVKTRELQLKILVSEQEKEWLDELARDAESTVAEFLRAHIRSAHAEKVRRATRMESQPIKLSTRERWLYDRIKKGGPLGEPLSIESLDHDSRAEFGDEIVFERSGILTKLREAGFIRRVGPQGRDFEATSKKLPKQ